MRETGGENRNTTTPVGNERRMHMCEAVTWRKAVIFVREMGNTQYLNHFRSCVCVYMGILEKRKNLFLFVYTSRWRATCYPRRVCRLANHMLTSYPARDSSQSECRIGAYTRAGACGLTVATRESWIFMRFSFIKMRYLVVYLCPVSVLITRSISPSPRRVIKYSSITVFYNGKLYINQMFRFRVLEKEVKIALLKGNTTRQCFVFFIWLD